MKIWVQNFAPRTLKSRLFVFTTKHVNPLLFGLTAEESGVKLPQLNGFFNKDLHSVKNVTPKKFNPDLQIFYTFPVFGLNVHVLRVKVHPNATKRIIFIKLYPTPERRMLLSENLPQTSRFFTRIYPQYPWHYATLYIVSIFCLMILEYWECLAIPKKIQFYLGIFAKWRTPPFGNFCPLFFRNFWSVFVILRWF